MPLSPQRKRLITAQLARRYGLDPRAVLAVAGVEGGFRGAVGDAGTSFGPFQLHWGGAMPSPYVGNYQASQRFANSRRGIKYAIRQMSGVAKGLQGREAVAAVVRRFERPADPDSEIQRAMALYGKSPVAGRGGPVAFGGEGVSVGGGREALLRSIMAQNAAFAAGMPTNPTAMTALLLSSRMGQDTATLGGPGGGLGRAGGIASSAKRGPQAMLAAIRLARKMGLSARENPFVDPVDPVHVENSYHYRTFPGLFKGRKLGRGLDVSGDPRKLRRYARIIDRRFNPAELFHDPLGGKYRIGGHDRHVHVGF